MDRSNALKTLAAVIGLLALVAVPIIADAAGSTAWISMATRILIYGMAAASLNFALGYGGLVSFGHAAFFGLGGYVVGILYQTYADETLLFGFIPGTNQLLVTLPATILVTGIAAAAIGALSLRTGGVQFIMITLAFAQMLFFFFSGLSAYGGEDGLIIRRTNELFGLNMRDRATLYWVTLAITALFFVIYRRLTMSSFGTIVSGLRQNERRMAALGIEAYRYRLIAFILSGIGTGIAGAMLANVMRFTSPDLLAWHTSGQLMIMVILGGVGTVTGPFLGAAVLLILEDVLNAWTENWPLILGLVLLVVVLQARGGLMAIVNLVRGNRS
ncbi:branched-chain amino acid ABC transporter permease [Acuticoccus sp. M5D2P5]|uniref:branched-chain amino acid ABC transporter permease n=1 Tax=Acuticoccus kalidii TaxID=2910977 RepID=UPI001F42D6D3|nr:branched-chain amino acid ABC transporter permease [Acuticoccus kalidii]MCF3936717.1 branched-chain amino acid ABC transporter permease [Acuticoccus kalidii]